MVRLLSDLYLQCPALQTNGSSPEVCKEVLLDISTNLQGQIQGGGSRGLGGGLRDPQTS